MKNIKLIIASILLLNLTGYLSFGQSYIPQYLQDPDDFITTKTTIFDSSGWFVINRDYNITTSEFVATKKSSLGLGADDNLVLVKATTDNFSFTNDENRYTHHKYQQQYKGLDVQFAQFFFHEKDGYLRYLSCKVAEGLNINIQPTLNEAQALAATITALGNSNQYIWLDSEYEQEYRLEKGDSSATYYPVGKLMICYIGDGRDYSASNFKLAWKYTIQSLQPVFTYETYVDANTGILLRSNSLMCNGSADLLYYGNKSITTDWRGAPHWNYRLKANLGGSNIHTKWATYNNGGSLKDHNLVSNITDGNDSWGNGDAVATTPHWAAVESHNYFWNNFAQSGIDNNWGELRIFANATHGEAISNAYWSIGNVDNNNNSKDYITVGNHNGTHLCAIDILGHEFAHGVNHSQADLQYQNESGALSESFSDIFGFMIEKYTQGGVISDWNLGEDALLVRRMNQPSLSPIPATGQPFRYQGPIWYNLAGCTPTKNNDYCGVHTNSGVQNYWFFLLSQGSTGAPDGTFNNFTVNGIGADAASRIAYYNLSYQLNQNSTYTDARNGSIWSSIFLYGNCSNEFKQTNNAWACVGIGNPITPLSISGPSIVYHFQNGSVLGSMPKNYTASGDIPNYNWIYTGPWAYNVTGAQNQTFSLASFNNSFVPANIQVNGSCECLSKKITFSCLDCNMQNGGGTIDNGHVALYPNPARDVIHVVADFPEANPNDPIIVTIIDMNGVYLFQQSYNEHLPESINVSNLLAGNYILVVHQGNNIQQLRFTKQ